MSRELLKEILATLEGNDDYYFLRGKIRRELAKPDSEPVSHQFQDEDGKWCNFMNKAHYENTVKAGHKVRQLFTQPTASKPLTAAEINNIWVGTGNRFEFARAIEKAHGIGDL
jgi:hypothetical protein